MRDPGNDAQAVRQPAQRTPERRCVLTGARAGRPQLLRLVAGPDGRAWPDPAGRLPGRGAWISLDQQALAAAIASGALQAALRRAFKAAIEVPADLPARIATMLERRALDRLGLEHRAGQLLFGSDKLAEWARAGRLQLLLHAADAAEDGCARLDQAWRAGRNAGRSADSNGGAAAPIRLPVGRDGLSRALGRENVVHSGVIHAKAAARIVAALDSWLAFTGTTTRGNDPRGNDIGTNAPTGGNPAGWQNDKGQE